MPRRVSTGVPMLAEILGMLVMGSVLGLFMGVITHYIEAR